MSCTYYRLDEGFLGVDYWCDKKNCRVDSDTYYKYCRNYDYRDCPIYKQESSSGCFLTTVSCEILGLPDKHPVLNTLRNFRDNILQKDKEYEEILKIYDSIGPIVATRLKQDENSYQKAEELFQFSLLPIVKEINNNNYSKAIKHYLYMTLYLVNDYKLASTYNTLKDTNYGFINFNQKIAGHGQRRVLTRKETV